MAKSKIEANVKFTESGAEQTAKKVDKLKGSSNKAAEVIGQLNKKLDKIGKAAGISATIDSIKAVGSAVSSVKNLVGGAVSSLYGFLNGQASAGDNIAKLSRSLGLSSKEFEKLQYAANRGGVSTEEFSSSMQKFSVNVAKAAAGEKNMKSLFNAMGVSLKDRNGKMKTNAALMLEVADVYTKLTNAQDKNRVSAELFGKSAMKMSTVFEGGSAGLKELMDRRESLGGLLSPEDTKNAEDFEDKVLDVSKAFESVQRKVAYTLMPAVNKLLDNLLDWWTGNGERMMEKIGGYSDKIAGFIGEIGTRIPGIIDSLGTAFDVVAGIVQEFGVGNTVLAGIVAAVGITLVPALAAASAAAAALGGALTPIVGIIAGIAGIAVGIKETIENWDLLASAALDVFAKIKKEVKEIVDWWREVPIIGSAIEFAGAGLDKVKDFFVGKVEFDTPKNAIEIPSRVDNIPQERDPAGVPVMRQYSESKSTTTNRLQVDFTGMQKGMTVTPGPNFDSSVIDYTAGYVFGN